MTLPISPAAVEDFLRELAKAKGATYVSVSMHTREDGSVFFAASAHRKWNTQSVHGDTLAYAVEKLLSCKDWFDASPKQETA